MSHLAAARLVLLAGVATGVPLRGEGPRGAVADTADTLCLLLLPVASEPHLKAPPPPVCGLLLASSSALPTSWVPLHQGHFLFASKPGARSGALS